jgi:hypothetical protein
MAATRTPICIDMSIFMLNFRSALDRAFLSDAASKEPSDISCTVQTSPLSGMHGKITCHQHHSLPASNTDAGILNTIERF